MTYFNGGLVSYEPLLQSLIEVYNAGPTAVNMTGWLFSDLSASNNHVIGTYIIPSGAYAILGRNGNTAVNGGVTVAYVYGTRAHPALNNGGDTLTLTDSAGIVQDTVNYALAGFPLTSSGNDGYSLQLKSLSMDNSVGASWCASTKAWPGSAGDFGTPGMPSDCAP